MTVRSQEPESDDKRVPCEVYSRIVGYLRPVQDWNRGKRQEFRDRRPYGVAEEKPSDVVVETADSTAR